MKGVENVETLKDLQSANKALAKRVIELSKENEMLKARLENYKRNEEVLRKKEIVNNVVVNQIANVCPVLKIVNSSTGTQINTVMFEGLGLINALRCFGSEIGKEFNNIKSNDSD